MEESKYQLIIQQIRKAGYKITNPREIILKEMIKNAHHMSVEELYEELKAKKIGMATIYRTMNLFEEIGIAKKIHINQITYFELKMYGKKPLHIHFQCRKCGKVYDVDDHDFILEILKFYPKVEEKYEVNVEDVDIVLFGFCKSCLKK